MRRAAGVLGEKTTDGEEREIGKLRTMRARLEHPPVGSNA